MKRVRFWGTRGSLPVALTAADVRAKLVAAVRGAARAAVARRTPTSRPTSTACDFALAGTFGGHTLLRRDRDRRPRLRAVRPRQRRAAVRRRRRSRATGRARRRPTTSSCPTCTGTTSWGCRSSRRPTSRATASAIYGGHAELEAALRRQQEPPSFPVDFSTMRADIEFVHLEPGVRHEIAGMTVTPHAAAPRRRFLRLPLRARRPDASSTRPTPSTSWPSRSETAALRRVLPRRRPRDLRRDVLAGRRDLGQGRLGPLEQRRRRRAVPAGRRRAPVPVPPRAGPRRRGDRGACSRTRGGSRRSRAAAQPLRVTAAYDGMEIGL